MATTRAPSNTRFIRGSSEKCVPLPAAGGPGGTVVDIVVRARGRVPVRTRRKFVGFFACYSGPGARKQYPLPRLIFFSRRHGGTSQYPRPGGERHATNRGCSILDLVP